MCDGRNLWIMTEGQVEDVQTHPATSAIVGEYLHWYHRHFNPLTLS